MATILIVDDQAVNREYLVTLLGYSGHRMLEAADGEQGLAQVRSQRPDLVIADVLMPTMDGYEFVRRIRLEPEIAHTQVVFFTATYHERAARALAEKCGVVYFITKPCEPQDVLRVVEEALRAAGRAPEVQVAQDFSPEHVRLLTDKLSNKVAELELVNQQLQAMNILGRQMALERNGARVLEIFCRAGREVLGTRYSALGVLDAANHTFSQFFVYGLDDPAVKRVTPPALEGPLCDRVIREAQPYRASGAEAAGAWFRAITPAVPVASLLAVPMASPSQRYGALFLINKVVAGEFSEEDEAAALTLAAQAAVAYENLLRVEDIQRHAALLEQQVAERTRAEREIRLLASMTQAIGAAADEHGALGIVLSELSEAVGWVLGQAWTPSADGSVLECSTAYHCTASELEPFRMASEGYRFAPNIGLPARAWAQKKPAWLQTVAHTPAFPRARLAEELGLKAGIAIPVIDHDEVIAVLEFFAFEQREESEWLVQLGLAVAAQLGTAIQRKRAEAQIRIREGQQATIAALGQEALTGIDLDGLLHKAAVLITKNLEVEYCNVLELEPGGKSLLLRAGVGWKEGLVGRARVSTGTASQGGYALMSNEPVIVESLSTENRFSAGTLLGQHEITSGMSVIIFSHGSREAWGVLGAHSRARRRFTHDDVNFLQSAANLIANAVDRLREEAELEVARDAAEAANRAKDQFLARLSHELRTPLTPVLMTVSAAIDDPDTPASMRSLLEMTRRNVELEARLIDDLLDLTRITTGRLELDRRTVDIHHVIEQAIEICRGDIAAQRHQLTLDLGASQHFVNADSARLQQVFWNLIKNAVKFTMQGGTLAVRSRNGRVESKAAGGETWVFVEVTDNGMGIEPEALSKLFSPFANGNQGFRPRFGGLGLGLAISRSVAEAHGGTLKAASAGTNRGASFTFGLPTATAPAGVTLKPAAPPPPARTEPLKQRPLKILLVEDNKDTLRSIGMLLGLRQHKVSMAERLEDALAIANAETFDLILSDIQLPDGSGLELMRHVQATRPTPSIAMSGFGTDEDIQSSRDAGFLEHLIKPINFQKLEATILKVSTVNASRSESAGTDAGTGAPGAPKTAAEPKPSASERIAGS